MGSQAQGCGFVRTSVPEKNERPSFEFSGFARTGSLRGLRAFEFQEHQSISLRQITVDLAATGDFTSLSRTGQLLGHTQGCQDKQPVARRLGCSEFKLRQP